MQGEYVTAIGIAIQTALYLLAGYAMVIRNDTKRKETSDRLSEDVKDMKQQLEKLAEVITQQAVQNVRLDNMQKTIVMLQQNVEDLRRGHGFVKGAVDGEYPRP